MRVFIRDLRDRALLRDPSRPEKALAPARTGAARGGALALVMGCALLLPTTSHAEDDVRPDAPARPIPADSDPSQAPSTSTSPGIPQGVFTRFIHRAEELRPSLVRLTWKHAAGHDIVRHGVIVDASGHVLTAGAPIRPRHGLVLARLYGGRHARAEVRAEDLESGLTLLRVPGTDLRPVGFRRFAPRLPESTGMMAVPPRGPGQAPLVSVPMGLEVALVTADGGVGIGKVRAVDRLATGTAREAGQRYPTVGGLVEAGLAALPTDMGAPWIDANGEVVGLQITSGLGMPLDHIVQDAAARGLKIRPMPTAARAVPSSIIRIVLPKLLAGRPLYRAGLGVETVPADAAMRVHLCQRYGCHVVRAVEPESPAAEAGLREHDVILRINGRRLRPHTRLKDVLLPFRPGAEVTLEVLRKRKPLTVTLRLETRQVSPRIGDDRD